MMKKILIGVVAIGSVCWADNAPTTAPTPAVIRRFSKFDSMIDDTVREANVTKEQDPLKFISKDMKAVSGDLAEDQTGQPTQQKEDAVVGQLDDVIKLLEAQCKSGNGSSLNPMKPLADSKRGGGPGGIHELTDPQAAGKEWGQLSPKQRDQILQSKTDGFPQGYESLLQSYYKRLAQEQVSDDKSGGAPAVNAANTPTTTPSN
jgi:hypothetical protein